MNRFLRQVVSALFFNPVRHIVMEGEPGAGGGGPPGAAPAGGSGASSLSGGGTATVVVPPNGETPAGGSGEKPWYGEFKDEGVRGWLDSLKGAYKSPEEIAIKAWSLEKLLGADKAGRAVVPPKADAPEAEWKTFYSKIGGVPEKPEGYTLPKDTDPKIVEALSKDPMLKKFQDYAHSLGMPQKFFGDTLKWFMTESKGKIGEIEANFAKQTEADWTALRTEWGGEFAAKHEQAKRAAGTFIEGTPEQRAVVLEKMEQAMGTKGLMTFFQKLGSSFGEHVYVGGDGKVAGDGSMSPEAAQVRIKELESDAAWRKGYLEGDIVKRDEMNKLMAMAFPGQQRLR